MRKFLAFVLAMCLAFPGAALAEINFEWIAGGSVGTWNLPTNWVDTDDTGLVGPVPGGAGRRTDDVTIDTVLPFHALLDDTRIITDLRIGQGRTNNVNNVGRLDIGTRGELVTLGDDVVIGNAGTGTVNVQGSWLVATGGDPVAMPDAETQGVTAITVETAEDANRFAVDGANRRMNTRNPAVWEIEQTPANFGMGLDNIVWDNIGADHEGLAVTVDNATGVISATVGNNNAVGNVNITARIPGGRREIGGLGLGEFSQVFTVSAAANADPALRHVTITAGAPTLGMITPLEPNNLAIGAAGTAIGELNINGGSVAVRDLTLAGAGNARATVNVNEGSLETAGVTIVGPSGHDIPPAITVTGGEWDANGAINFFGSNLTIDANSVLGMRNDGPAIAARTIDLNNSTMTVGGLVAGQSITNTVAVNLNNSWLEIGSLDTRMQVGISNLRGTDAGAPNAFPTIFFNHNGAWAYPAGAEQIFNAAGSIVNLDPVIGIGQRAGEMTLTSLGNLDSAARNVWVTGGTLVLGVGAIPAIPATAEPVANTARDALIRLQGGELRWANGNTFDASVRMNRNAFNSWGTIDVGSNDVVFAQIPRVNIAPNPVGTGTITVRSSDTAAGALSTSARGEGSLRLDQVAGTMNGRWVITEGTFILGANTTLNGELVVLGGATLEIAEGVTFTNANSGVITIDGLVNNAGNIVNNGVFTAIDPEGLGNITGNDVIPQDGTGGGDRPEIPGGGPGTPGEPGTPGPQGPRGDSGSGCNAGFGLVALLGAALLVFRRK